MNKRKKKEEEAPRPVGRPLMGKEKVAAISVCLPPEKIARLDELAKQWGVSRSGAIAKLIRD